MKEDPEIPATTDAGATYDPRLVILHGDMDAFFAAVEVLDDPSLRGAPLIIGHPSRRGVVSTASYEARKFGVHSAQPSLVARRLCPHAVWRSPRLARYAEVSRQVRSVFQTFTPVVEPLSLDEAFLDVAGSLRLFGGAIEIARRLKNDVRRATGGLTVSVGVAENKFLAKIGSDFQKPDGLTVVPPGRAAEFLAPLPIRRLWGVGPKTARVLEDLGLRAIGDIPRLGLAALERRLGKGAAEHIWHLAHGRDLREVESIHEAKSISTESTFQEDLRDERAMRDFLFEAAETVAEALRAAHLKARTVQIKVRTGSFRTWTRARTLDAPTDIAEDLYEVAVELLADRIDLGGEGVRLLGVGGKGLVEASNPVQASLFDADSDRRRRAALLADAIKDAHGKEAIRKARLLPRRDERPPARAARDDPGRVRRRDLE